MVQRRALCAVRLLASAYFRQNDRTAHETARYQCPERDDDDDDGVADPPSWEAKWMMCFRASLVFPEVAPERESDR